MLQLQRLFTSSHAHLRAIVPKLTRIHANFSTQKPFSNLALHRASTLRRYRVIDSQRFHVTCQATATGDEASNASRNIVLAIDTSSDSMYACKWALDNVYRQGDVVHLLHCLPALPKQGMYTLPDGRLAIVDFDKLMVNEEEYLKAAERSIAQSFFKLFHDTKVPYVIHLIREDPLTAGDKGVIARDLCVKAEELNAAVLVLASHTRSQLTELFVGSVSNWCTHNSKIPVMVLHAPQAPPAKAKPAGGIAKWLKELLQLNHKETQGTAAETVAAEAAGKVIAAAHAHPEIVNSTDFPPEEKNLVGEVYGLEDELTTAGAASGTAGTVTNSRASSGGVATGGTGRHIIVPVDDTDASERACAWAVNNIWRKGDTVHVVHIVPSMPRIAYAASPNFGGGESFAIVLDTPTDNNAAEVEEYLHKRFLPMLTGVDHTRDVLLEPTEDSVAGVGRAICDRADAVDAAVMVLGSHMRGGIQEFMLGSVAQWVAHHSSKPVAVLH